MDRRPGLAEIVAALISAAATAWVLATPQERYWVQLRALNLARQLTGRLARKAGHRGMGDELAGRDFQRYQVALLLSRARDGLGRVIEEMRP